MTCMSRFDHLDVHFRIRSLTNTVRGAVWYDSRMLDHTSLLINVIFEMYVNHVVKNTESAIQSPCIIDNLIRTKAFFLGQAYCLI